MQTCRRCGRPLAPDAGSCAGCGASNGRSLAGALAAIVAVLAMVAGFAAYAVFAEPTRTAGFPTADPNHRAAVQAPAPSSSEQPTPVPPPQDTPVPETADAALDELRVILDADRPMVETLVDQWVPQLSAKRPGLVVRGVTYDYVEILRDYRATQARYPDALLLFSGEYTSFRYGDFWITVQPLAHHDGPAANAWCTAEAIPVDDCYAKMISHTVGYEGSTLLRGR